MATVQLQGKIPVSVFVEVNEERGDGSVSRVIAHDDSFEYEMNDEGFYVVGPDTPDVTDAQSEIAVGVAEGSVWPGWEWGA